MNLTPEERAHLDSFVDKERGHLVDARLRLQRIETRMATLELVASIAALNDEELSEYQIAKRDLGPARSRVGAIVERLAKLEAALVEDAF